MNHMVLFVSPLTPVSVKCYAKALCQRKGSVSQKMRVIHPVHQEVPHVATPLHSLSVAWECKPQVPNSPCMYADPFCVFLHQNMGAQDMLY